MNEQFRNSAIHTLAEILCDHGRSTILRRSIREAIAAFAMHSTSEECIYRLNAIEFDMLTTNEKSVVCALIKGC